MDRGETWQGGRPLPQRHCVIDGDPVPLKWGTAPHFLAHVYCGQTAGWIKMPLGSEVDLGPGHMDGDPAPPQKGHSSSPLFGPCLLWPSQLLLSSCYFALHKCAHYFANDIYVIVVALSLSLSVMMLSVSALHCCCCCCCYTLIAVRGNLQSTAGVYLATPYGRSIPPEKFYSP